MRCDNKYKDRFLKNKHACIYTQMGITHFKVENLGSWSLIIMMQTILGVPLFELILATDTYLLKSNSANKTSFFLKTDFICW